MKTPNYKKAVRDLARMNNNTLLYHKLSEYAIVVSDGHCVITVPKTDFREISADLDKVKFIEKYELYQAVSNWDNLQGQLVEETPLQIKIEQNTIQVFKDKKDLIAINQKFIEIIKNSIFLDDFKLYCMGKNTPLYCINRADDNIFHVVAVLPVKMNVNNDIKTIINKVLE